MNKKNIIKMGTAGLCMLMLTGCGGQNKKTYDQAVTDLEQGSYDYALEGYKSSITAGYKSAQSYRGAGIACLHLGNYQDAIDSFGKALDESDGIVNSFELDVLKYRGEAEYKLADYKAAAQTYGILAEVDGGKAEYLYYKAASEAADGQAEDAEKDFAAAEEKAKNSKKSSAAAPGVSLAFTALASAARDAGDSELAAQYCNQAIERRFIISLRSVKWRLAIMRARCPIMRRRFRWQTVRRRW